MSNIYSRNFFVVQWKLTEGLTESYYPAGKLQTIKVTPR